mmetsp:Transcript_18573/g.32963  ORF Transcript_18573/g.32963 Transcript_18573/m.32963 type:complete len:532 (+) Transcript_18573:83-1678(+)
MATFVNLTANEKSIIEKLFRDWDLDGSGTIEQEELQKIMFQVSPDMSRADVDRLVALVDTDNNGIINFAEFVAWLTDPSSKQTVDEDGWLSDMDLRKMLQPLFACFDKNGDGSIAVDEFRDCTKILENSMALCSQQAAKKLGRAPSKEGAQSSVFREFNVADGNCDGKVTFEEFVQWQSEVLKAAGIPNTALPKLLEEVVQALEVVYDIDRLMAGGGRGLGRRASTACTTAALQGAIQKVAEVSQRLYTSKKGLLLGDLDQKLQVVERQVLLTRWRDPPPDSWALLVRRCAKEMGLLLPSGSTPADAKAPRKSIAPRRWSAFCRRSASMSSVESAVGKVVMIIPEAVVRHPVLCEQLPTKRWFAQVSRAESHGEEHSQDHFFVLTQDFRLDWCWTALDDSAEFDKALQALPKELVVLALLKSQALMSNSIQWNAVQDALTTATLLKFLSAAALPCYTKFMLAELLEHTLDLDEHEQKEFGLSSLEEMAIEYLKDLTLDPADVMAVLSDLKVLEVSDDAWSQILSRGRSADL